MYLSPVLFIVCFPSIRIRYMDSSDQKVPDRLFVVRIDQHDLFSGIAKSVDISLVIFLKTGNIWLVSALHSVWNFAQGNFFGILVSGNDFGPTVLSTTFNASKTLINGGDFGLEGGLAVTTVLVIGTLLVLFVPSNKDGKVE